MKLEHSFTVPVPVEQAWQVLLDIEQVAPCMPGASLETVEGDEFTGSVKVKVGPINLTYKGKARFTAKDEATHHASIDAQGKDRRGNGTASAVVNAQLHGDGDQTRVEVQTDLNVTGKPAQFGRGVMTDVGNKLIGQFADCLAGKLAGGAEQGAEEAAAAEPASAGQPAPAQATAAAGEQVRTDEDVAPADQVAPPAPVAAAMPEAPTGPTPLADAAPVAPAGARPETDRPAEQPAGRPAEQPAGPPAAQIRAVPSHRPESQVEPIDLLGSAGLPVLKRVAPVAGAVGALLGLVALLRRRRRRHHRRRR